jgi:hypothetical protein
MKQHAKTIKQTLVTACSSDFKTRCESIPVRSCSDLQQSTAILKVQFVIDLLERNLNAVISLNQEVLPTEEATAAQYVLHVDTREFLPQLVAVKDMANSLLTEHYQDPVGHNWAANPVKR